MCLCKSSTSTEFWCVLRGVQVIFPADADLDTRANLLGTNVLIDFTWSESSGGVVLTRARKGIS